MKGETIGPVFCDALKGFYGTANVACQGIDNPPYTAGILDNFNGLGTSEAAINEAIRMFNLAYSKCPKTIVIASGYSQGAAVMHASIKTLSITLQNQIGAAVMFGDVRNTQDNGQIPNFPKSKTKIYCAPLDLVCLGTDLLTPTHLVYTSYSGQALDFVKSLVTKK